LILSVKALSRRANAAPLAKTRVFENLKKAFAFQSLRHGPHAEPTNGDWLGTGSFVDFSKDDDYEDAALLLNRNLKNDHVVCCSDSIGYATSSHLRPKSKRSTPAPNVSPATAKLPSGTP
jgi:hypothetical protein